MRSNVVKASALLLLVPLAARSEEPGAYKDAIHTSNTIHVSLHADSLRLIEPSKAPNIMDGFKDAGIVVGVIAGVFGLFYNATSLLGSTRQRNMELRWKQANMARELLKDIRSNEQSNAALMMLDWQGKQYRKPDGSSTQAIDYADLSIALTKASGYTSQNDDGIFIRDAFDILFEKMSEIQRHIDSHLILHEDVGEFFAFYVERIFERQNENLRIALFEFLEEYRYDSARRLIETISKQNA